MFIPTPSCVSASRYKLLIDGVFVDNLDRTVTPITQVPVSGAVAVVFRGQRSEILVVGGKEKRASFVFFTMCLFVTLLYVFAIMLKQLFGTLGSFNGPFGL